MIPVRTSVIVKDGGVTVDILLTPHLYSFAEHFGIDFSTDLHVDREVMENYADILFLGAVNAWVLDAKGTVDDIPFTRGDFHAWAAQEPKAFGKYVLFAVSALTGKTPGELAAETQKKAEERKKAAEPEPSKKKRWLWIGRRSKRSS